MINKNNEKILDILKKTYPQAKIALNFGNSWELLVSVILSAQCTDKMVNIVTTRLFQKYKTLEDYVLADESDFGSDIKSTGFYKNKAKNILTTAKMIKDKFDGKIPDNMEDLLTLAGIARKSANIILGNVYQKVVGIAVDTHVHRISQRLRLVEIGKIGGKKKIMCKKNNKEIIDFVKDADPNKIEQELMKLIPRGQWFHYTYRIIDHGRSICKAQNPQCVICPLQKLCPCSRV